MINEQNDQNESADGQKETSKVHLRLDNHPSNSVQFDSILAGNGCG